MPNPSADLAVCRAMLRDGSRTFLAASFLLPKSVRDPACALYAFCRLADDAVDHGSDGAAGLAAMRDRMVRAYEGRPVAQPMDRAFADVVARYAIPRALPEALLEGFEWDLAGRRYDDLDALEAYAARVAGSVGAMMALVMGVRSPQGLARACDLGIAMQLSNIARDVGEDARAGRVYLPLHWLADAGVDPGAWLRHPIASAAMRTVVQRLVHRADAIYARVDAGIGLLPPVCRPGIRAARVLYAEIGREVERQDLDSVSRRAVVRGSRKAALLAGTLLGPGSARSHAADPPLAAARFLVDVADRARPRELAPVRRHDPALRWWNLGRRAVAAIDLFERLERRDDGRRAGARAVASARQA